MMSGTAANNQGGHVRTVLVNGGLAQRVIPYTNDKLFSLPEGLLIRDCILKKPVRYREVGTKNSGN